MFTMLGVVLRQMFTMLGNAGRCSYSFKTVEAWLNSRLALEVCKRKISAFDKSEFASETIIL